MSFLGHDVASYFEKMDTFVSRVDVELLDDDLAGRMNAVINLYFSVLDVHGLKVKLKGESGVDLILQFI